MKGLHIDFEYTFQRLYTPLTPLSRRNFHIPDESSHNHSERQRQSLWKRGTFSGLRQSFHSIVNLKHFTVRMRVFTVRMTVFYSLENSVIPRGIIRFSRLSSHFRHKAHVIALKLSVG
jgi:hypothetical protein